MVNDIARLKQVYPFIGNASIGTSVLGKEFSAMVIGSLGVLSGVFLYYLGKVLYSWTLRYIKFNVQIIRGGRT